MKPLRWRLYVCCLLVCLYGGLAHAADWFLSDLNAALDDPLRLSRIRGVGLSLQAGKYRAEVEHNGSSGVARALTVIPTIVLTTSPNRQFRPYLGAGVGLSLSELTPGNEQVPLHLEENFIMHVGGGFSYRLAPGVAFISSARYSQSWDSDLFARFASPQLPLGNGGLGLNNLSVQFGIRMRF
jgi:opacity protein-like surface antigen